MVEITKINEYRNKLLFTVTNAIQYSGFVDQGNFSGWQQVATTTKTPFVCTANTGYTIVNQDCYTQNGMAYINIAIKNADSTMFIGGQHQLFSCPYTPKNIIPFSITLGNADGYLQQPPIISSGALWTNSNGYCTLNSNTAYYITVYASFKI